MFFVFKRSFAGKGGGNGITMKSPKRSSPPCVDLSPAVRGKKFSSVRPLQALSSREPCSPNAIAEAEIRLRPGSSYSVFARADTVREVWTLVSPRTYHRRRSRFRW